MNEMRQFFFVNFICHSIFDSFYKKFFQSLIKSGVLNRNFEK